MRPLAFALSLAVAGVLAPSLGRADEAPSVRVRIQDRGPNRMLLATGIATLGFAYFVSSYVGVTSPHEADRFLVVPAVGPFIALAERHDCGPQPTGTCANEPTYEGLLVASGAMQLAGIAQIAVAFVIRERREIERPIVLPLAMRDGSGLAAMTTF